MFEIMHEISSLNALLAYFDPGPGSLLMQALLGGAAGFLVLARYLWDRAPGLFRRRKPVAVKVEAEHPPRGM